MKRRSAILFGTFVVTLAAAQMPNVNHGATPGPSRHGLWCLVLMTPYMIEPSRRDPMRALMDRYGAAVKKIALRHGTVFVDTQAAFDAALKHMHPMALAWDRIHPCLAGHMILARALLSAVGFKA